MLAKLARELPRGTGLFYEPKWDGFRCIVFRDGDEVELGSRNEKPLTRYFPELVDALRQELPDRIVLDGEIVIAGPGGLEFDALSQRIHPAEKRIRQLAESTPASFVAFDLLAEGDRSFMEAPYAERRAALETALKKARPPVHVTPVTDDPDVGADWFARVRGRRARRRRRQGRGTQVPARQAGDGQGEAPAHGGLRGGGLPHPQGRRRCGLTALGTVRSLRDVAPRRRGLGVQRGPPTRAGDRARAVPEERAEGSPLGGMGRGAGRRPRAGGTNRWNAGKDMTWEPLRPEAVCEVSYDHLQQERFRHATSFVRWRPDRDAVSCTYAQLDTPVPMELSEVFGTSSG